MPPLHSGSVCYHFDSGPRLRSHYLFGNLCRLCINIALLHPWVFVFICLHNSHTTVTQHTYHQHTHSLLSTLLRKCSCCIYTWGSPRVRTKEPSGLNPGPICWHSCSHIHLLQIKPQYYQKYSACVNGAIEPSIPVISATAWFGSHVVQCGWNGWPINSSLTPASSITHMHAWTQAWRSDRHADPGALASSTTHRQGHTRTHRCVLINKGLAFEQCIPPCKG